MVPAAVVPFAVCELVPKRLKQRKCRGKERQRELEHRVEPAGVIVEFNRGFDPFDPQQLPVGERAGHEDFVRRIGGEEDAVPFCLGGDRRARKDL